MLIKDIHSIFLKCPNICTDSRNKLQNGLFFALKGENFDGNFFADIALSNGCEYAIIDNPDIKRNDNYILVKDVLATLQELATFHRKFLNIPIIGITGTNGKTTTKELINVVLSKKYRTQCTQGNLNNHIGVPLTLLSLKSDTEIGIIEMGANHPGEIRELCEIAQPNYGIITNIGKAHLQGFGSYEGVKNTKKELYDYIKETKGLVFVNKNDVLLDSLSKGINSFYYGDSPDLPCNGRLLSNSLYVSLLCKSNSNEFEIHSNLFGNYNANNILAACCIGTYFKLTTDSLKEAIENYIPTNNRSQLTKTKTNVLFLDAYNANPSSMLASVSNFNTLTLDNKILILGEMFELGNDHEIEHTKIIQHIDNMKFKDIFLVGNWGNMHFDKATRFKTTSDLIDWLKINKIKNSNILIKGSRGVKLERIIEFL